MKKHCWTVTIKHDWLCWHLYERAKRTRVTVFCAVPNFLLFLFLMSAKSNVEVTAYSICVEGRLRFFPTLHIKPYNI